MNMKNKPLIFVTPSREPDPVNGNIDQIRVHKNYADSIYQAGGVPLIPAFSGEELRSLVDASDGLLLTGGRDVAPRRYGEQTSPECGKLDLWRDELEWALIDAFIQQKKPIFGICRGLQMINTFFGGTLYQDLATASFPEHRNSVHAVQVVKDSLLDQLYGRSFTVNSFHHQAVQKIGKGLSVIADSDGVVEGIKHQTLPIFAVQWHPERMTGKDRFSPDGPDMHLLFAWWVNSTKNV